MSFTKRGEAPQLTEARKRLEVLERRTPPGLPLGYILQSNRYVCLGCGSSHVVDLLFTRWRAKGDSHRAVLTASNEKIYDLPIDQTMLHHATARCINCIDVLPREALPKLPPIKAKLSGLQGSKEPSRIDLVALFGGKK